MDAGLIYGAVLVEWMSFAGENQGAYNLLDWKVTSQINVSHYEVQRSIDGSSNFETIGKLLSEGESAEIVDYDYHDYDIAQAGVYYYRILQLDIDGNFSYTDVIAIDIAAMTVELPKAIVLS